MQRALFGRPSICIRCRLQAVQRPQFLNRQRQFATAPVLRLPAEAQKKSKDDEPEFVPQPLGRPIGFPNPPKAGENLGIKQKKVYTGKTMSERNLQKRKDIVEKWGTNYFRDFKNIRKYRSGKTFIANPRVFKQEAALYFPNLHGETLAESKADTTPVLKGKISVVNVYSSHWGEMQSWTFTGKKENPELQEILKANKDVAQMVDVNVEENTLKAWIVAIFQWRLRRQRPKEDWGKYFVIRKGVSQQIREMIGLLNSRVGYVYLVDEQCKIRWAGSANAEGTEKEDLNKGLQRLIENWTTRRSELRPDRCAKSPVERNSKLRWSMLGLLDPHLESAIGASK
jgi:ATPase complex subunit ATP10